MLVLCAIIGVVFVIAVVYEIAVSVLLKVCDTYIKHTYDKENRSKLGWWVYSQYRSEYIESLKEGKAY